MISPSLELEPKSTDEVTTVDDVSPAVISDDDELQDLRDFKERWNDAKANVAHKQSRVAYLKDQLKTAKQAHDVAVAELLALDEEEMPLFDKKPSKSAKPAAAAAEKVNEAWREFHITELHLSDRTTELLLSASPSPIETIGDLTDFLNDRKGRRYTDIDGIGPAKAQEIDDAMVNFFANHPEFCQSGTEPDDTESGEAEEDPYDFEEDEVDDE